MPHNKGRVLIALYESSVANTAFTGSVADRKQTSVIVKAPFR
jgi:hypothetical protein